MRARRSGGGSWVRGRPCGLRTVAVRCKISWSADTGRSGCVVAAAGAVSHDQVVDEVERLFDGFAEGDVEPPPVGRYAGGEERAVRRLEQAHIVLGFEGLSFHDPGHYALHVFSSIVVRRYVVAPVPGDPRKARALL
jgi:hypothetical protein